MPKVAVLSGSTRSGSFNRLLAGEVARSVESKGGTATLIDLAAYPLVFVDAEVGAGEMPEAVQKLHALLAAQDGVFLVTPEYNSFPSPLLLNALDWLSRLRHYEGGMDEVFGKPLYAVGAASPSPIGGYRALMALRQKLEIGLGATVIPAMVHVASAFAAFDEDGKLKGEADVAMIDRAVGQLVGRLRR
jgi:NAD(P)H-dependent FMN reductase